jgi:murein DD-endopeptidase MepM/ murein hydrolase activator NlpD
MSTRSRFLAIVASGVSFTAVSTAMASVAYAADWKMPWKANVTVNINQGFHPDGYVPRSIDIGLSAGSDVLAPVDSKVIGRCFSSTGNQWAIQLRSSDNQTYSLIHVSVNGDPMGKDFKQGDKIGTVAFGTANDSCARSTNPHLHFGLPNADSTIDGQRINAGSAYVGRSLTSHNAGIPAVTMLVSKETGGALDGCGSPTGVELYIHPQVVGWSTCQKWQLKDVGNSEYMVINQQTQRPLDAGGANGAQVYLHPQQLNWNPYQKWKLQQSNDGYMFINVATGRVLDSGGASNPHAYMYPNAIPGHPPHIWKFQ